MRSSAAGVRSSNVRRLLSLLRNAADAGWRVRSMRCSSCQVSAHRVSDLKVSCCNRTWTGACRVFGVGKWSQLLTNCIAMCQGYVIKPQMPVIRAVAEWYMTAAGSAKCSMHGVFPNPQVLQSCSASS